LIYYKIK